MTGKVELFVVQRKLRGSTKWTYLLAYPGSKYVGVTPSLEEAKDLISADKGTMNLFLEGAEYRILRMELPCEVLK